MKLKTGTLVAAAVLAASMFANAQTAMPNYNQGTTPEAVTPPEAVAQPAMNGGALHGMIGSTPATNDNAQHMEDNHNGSKKNDHKQLAPDDPRKNPFWEPKDWNLINNLAP